MPHRTVPRTVRRTVRRTVPGAARRTARAGALAALALLPAACFFSRFPEYEPYVTDDGIHVMDVVIPVAAHLPYAAEGQLATIHYRASVQGRRDFDSSWDRGEPISFVIGAGDVPRGLDLGVVGMRLLGRRDLLVPPVHAFGDEGLDDLVPPDAWVLFEVELLALTEADGSPIEVEPPRG